jgi:hypothetical protein
MNEQVVLGILQALNAALTVFGPQARSLVAQMVAEHRDPTLDEIQSLQAARHATADRIREA